MKIPSGSCPIVTETPHAAGDAPGYILPRDVWRLWMPCDMGWLGARNPKGLHPPILEHGFDRAMAKGVWGGDHPLDETIEKRPNWVASWAAGCQTGGKVCGWDRLGRPITCDPRPLTDADPEFWTAAAPRIARSHELGGKVGLYVGQPELGSIGRGWISTRRRRIDKMLAPAIAAGFDVLMMDATNPTVQAWGKTDAMDVAERWRELGRLFVGEAPEEIRPELYPWHDGRFGAIAARHHDPAHSRWDLAASSKAWFGPGSGPSLKAHFCAIPGFVPVAERPRMLVPNVIGSDLCFNVVEMSDMPAEWLA